MSHRSKGTLRIVFTAEDLVLTRTATRTDLMWEMIGSLHRLQTRDGDRAMAAWRCQAHARLSERGLLPSVRSLLLPLAPRGPYFPDFLTPIEAQLGDEPGIQAFQDTPRTRVREEVDLLRRATGLPSADLEDLARGDQQTMRRLGDVVAGYCRAVVTPHLPDADHALTEERAFMLRHLVTGGPEQVLANLGPAMRWRPPVLEVDYPPGLDREIHLRGRGLTLIPSYFCRMNPIALVDPRLPPVLAYPVPRRPALGTPASDPLVALLGQTRAEILRCIALTSGCSTSELARDAGVSLSSASRHAHVLRQAKLIASVRHANLMLHHTTELGTRLLHTRQTLGQTPQGF
ncbi:helix-turn-helix domain-containing protein [Sphaerisporangium sp. TRM90804]|uniref:winged helix-turn-helix domain-containing protein n=1 Tax=Sphaerisporangium sp. TRM90804 TaxID=3031113 RepID=UPI002448FD19|nr:helix-turn-helix domain-containing protein [Sphaerisporangium sp. TRM90804]MDH2424867.1 helix-turn-helix domain-containing protein [Sphaerisporangium sp. TRM90804]